MRRIMPRKQREPDEQDAVIERLREFVRLGYMTGSEVARRMGIHNASVYSWLRGEFFPQIRNASQRS
jgi:hypothetical protein